MLKSKRKRRRRKCTPSLYCASGERIVRKGRQMNRRAIKNMKSFLRKFWKEGMSILDVGSFEVEIQGTFRDIISKGYTGIDIQPGPNVDLVVEPYEWPFENNHFDIVVSGFCLEHTERFWDVFKEMVRVLKSDGMMCIMAPCRFGVHKYPVDCWRFLPDGMAVLAKTYNVELVNAYIDSKDPSTCIGIFHKC